VLPPTSSDLLRDETRPYFLWWTDVTVGRFRDLLRSSDPQERAYWLGALLREANSRDVWLFVTPDDIRRDWPHLIRHLGRLEVHVGLAARARGSAVAAPRGARCLASSIRLVRRATSL
jgi:hypothetical protein